jgi:hypothetical protein
MPLQMRRDNFFLRETMRQRAFSDAWLISIETNLVKAATRSMFLPASFSSLTVRARG